MAEGVVLKGSLVGAICIGGGEDVTMNVGERQYCFLRSNGLRRANGEQDTARELKVFFDNCPVGTTDEVGSVAGAAKAVEGFLLCPRKLELSTSPCY